MIGQRCRAAVALLAMTIGVMLGATSGHAQATPPEWSVTGRVVRAAAGDEMRPVAGVWVALNRVGDDGAGVLDSVRTGADGSYRFTFQRSGDPDAIYFTDVVHGGVAYFTEPLVGVHVGGEDAELVVFDTTSAAGLLRLRGRHAVVGPPLEDRSRPIVEVFELTNDTSLTLVPGSDSQPVWSVALAPGARAPEVGGGDLPASVVTFRNGRAELHAPLAPGLRQLSVRYTLPADAFPFEITMEQPAELLEVLLAEGATAAGAGLHEEQTVEMEGEPYRRLLSTSSAAGDRIAFALGGSAASPLVVPIAIGGAVLVLAGALVYARRTAYSSRDN